MKKYSKLLVLLLSLALIIGAIAIVASANTAGGNVATVGGAEYATLADAISAAENGGTVKLIADATVDTTINVAKDITVDLNGFTLNTTGEAFTVNTNGNFTVKGDGEITATGTLVSNAAAKPTVNFIGDLSDIKITATGSGPLFNLMGGTYNFTNVGITANIPGPNNVINTPAGSSAVINLKVVNGVRTGSENSQNAAFFGLGGTSFLNADNVNLRADGVVIGFNNGHTGANVLYMKDSVITNINIKQKNGVLGAWASIQGLVRFENCLVDSAYRVFCLSCASTNSTAMVECVDTIVRMNGYTYTYTENGSLKREGQMLSRTVPMKMIGNSAVLSQGSLGVTNGEYNVQVDEGFRVNLPGFFEPGKIPDNKGFVYPDGTFPSNSTTYKFIYDPVGNQAAPYLLVKVGGELDKEKDQLTSKATYLWENNMSRLFADDYEGVMFRNDDDKTNKNATDCKVSSAIWEIGNTSNWWNAYGTYETEVVNGNQVLKYWVNPTATNPTGKRTFSKGPELPLFNGTTAANAMTPANHKVVVFEVDFATDSSVGFPQFNIKPHIRVNADGSGGDGSKSSAITVAPNGKITASALNTTGCKSVTASTTGWNRVSIIIYTDPASEYGYAYYYVNGELIGTSNDVYKVGSHIFAPRFSISASQNVGASLLLDNVIIAGYGDYQAPGEADGATKNPEFYLNNRAIDTGVTVNTIALGNKNFTDVNDALTAGNEMGVAPRLNGDVTTAQKVEVDGYINTGSYTIATADGSYAADVKYNGKDELLGLEFNEKYGGELPVYWFIGDLNDFDQIMKDEYYYQNTVKMGEVPSCDYKYPTIQLYEGDYNQLVQYAFNTSMDGKTPERLEPVSAAIMSTARELRYYPVYQEKSVYTWVIVDAITGEFKRGGTDTTLWNSNWNNNIKLGYGEILVACSDNFQPMGSIKLINKSTEGVTNKIWGFDVNGHNITVSALLNSSSIKQASMFTVNAGETVLLYSSRPGGKITALGADNTTDIKAGSGSIILVNSDRVNKVDNQYSIDTLATHKVVSDPETQRHTTVKVGAIDGKYSGNLVISSDSLVQAQTGDATSSINVEGITFVRNSMDNGFDIVRTEIYYGTVNVKNCNIFNPVGGNLVHSSGSRTVTDEETGKVYNTTAKVNFENCYYLTNTNGANLVGDNRGMDYVNFKNFVTNGRVNPSHKGCTIAYENVAANLLAPKLASGDIIKAAYNVPMQLPEGMNELVVTFYTYDPAKASELTSNTYKFLPYGSEAAEGATVLPLLTEITTTVDNTVDVTFKGLGNNKDTVVKYYKGGNVKPVEIADATLNTYKLTHDGTFSALPENVTDNVTIIPGAKLEKVAIGIKANLSIYSDFDINLYIPEAVANYVTSVTADGTLIETVIVEIDGVKYAKAIVSKASNKASETVNYEIKTSEGGNDLTFNITISVADYAKGILEGETYTAEDKQLMYYMLTYANEAYKYFGDKENYDAAISAILTANENAKGEGMAEQTYGKAITELALGSVFESATVKLTSAPAFVLNLKDGFAGTVTVTYGTNVRTYTVTATSDRELVIEGMKVYNFGAELTVNATGTIGETEVKTENAKYNLDTFVKYHTESDAPESVACEALLIALYDYVTCADLYTK